jgi:hypothetical protein
MKKVGIVLFIFTFILNNLVDLPRIWGWVPTILVMIFLNRHLIPQYWAMIWVRFKYGFNLPSKENYTCKNDYILPFAGKWCVEEGGVTKNLSVAWSEMSQRYAYFFTIINDDGTYYRHDKTVVENYLCYGKDILAVADGVVVKASKNHPNSKTDGETIHMDTWDMKGNHIIIRHNSDEYSYVGKLMPGSVTVNVGDKVKQGDVIARCGNSGYSAAPCLQFQLQSSKNFDISAGLPIAFTNIKTEDSLGYKTVYKKAGIKPPPTDGNLEIQGNKIYIGRGLNVENHVDNKYG